MAPSKAELDACLLSLRSTGRMLELLAGRASDSATQATLKEAAETAMRVASRLEQGSEKQPTTG